MRCVRAYAAVAAVVLLAPVVLLGGERQTRIRLGQGGTITAARVNPNRTAAAPTPLDPPLSRWESPDGRSNEPVGSSERRSASSPLAKGGPRGVEVVVRATNTAGGPVTPTFPHPRPRLAGWVPRIVVTTSDKHKSTFDDTYEHDLWSSYQGNALHAPANQNYAIGVLDTGSDVDIVGGSAAVTLGVTGQHLTANTVQLGGLGNEVVDANVTWPIGFFIAGFSAIQTNGLLDLNAVVGHSNVAGLAAPTIFCEGEEIISALIGTDLVAFKTTIVRVDTPRTILYQGREITGPDVTIQEQFEDVPQYPRWISIELGPDAAATAAYYPNIFDLEDQESPWIPTRLTAAAGFLPLGGWFFTTINLLEGEPGPTNVIQPVQMLVDTGSQTSIISSGVAASLSLPFEPDFTVDICGVGGVLEGVPGYYIDYVKINAAGGAMEFSRAPFVVLDLQSPAGGPLDGLLGMNFFWNRNITLEPSLTTSGFITVSDPVRFAGGDFDLDMDVDDQDAAGLAACSGGPATVTLPPDCEHIDVDSDLDIDLKDFAWLQRCYSGHGEPADTSCGPSN